MTRDGNEGPHNKSNLFEKALINYFLGMQFSPRCITSRKVKHFLSFDIALPGVWLLILINVFLCNRPQSEISADMKVPKPKDKRKAIKQTLAQKINKHRRERKFFL